MPATDIPKAPEAGRPHQSGAATEQRSMHSLAKHILSRPPPPALRPTFLAVGFVALSLVVAACTPTQTTTINGVPVDPSVEGNYGSQPLAPGEAARMFSDVCGGTLPNFARAQTRMSTAGFTVVASTGTQFHETYDASMRVLDGPGLGKTCSIVFATAANDAQTLQQLESVLGPVQETSFGRAIASQQGRTVILLPEPQRSGNQTYFNLRMWSER